MKGPRSRTRHVAWRLWECPQCARRLWTASQVVHQACVCAERGPWMVPVEVKSKRKSGFARLEPAATAIPALGSVTP